jgi:two-component SAPR family response regulator
MKYNQIEVLFFSKNAQLLSTFSSIFCDEDDFSFRSLSNIDKLYDLSKTQINRIILIDFSDEVDASRLIFYKKNIRFLSLPMIFILKNKNLKGDFKKEGFTCFDVVVKPINVNELLSTIRTLLGNSALSSELPIFIRGNWFTPKKNIFENSLGVSVRLTEKETKIINFLYEGRGEEISKDIILRGVWGYKKTISTHTLETHIYRLRKKLATGLNEKDLILKSPKGYFLNLL